jgi:indolepyruvate ferredoxin oxidoreductase
MAAHVEGKGAIVLDMSGLAQKGGPVMSHVRLADKQAICIRPASALVAPIW